MKQVYEKPMVAIESFALSQSISACSGTKIGLNSSQCVMNDSDSTYWMKVYAAQGWFLSTPDDCTKSAKGMSFEDGVCYHTSSASVTFAST